MTTPIDVATDEMQKMVAALNRKRAEFLAEGLAFSFVTDPAVPGVGLQAPTGRLTTF